MDSVLDSAIDLAREAAIVAADDAAAVGAHLGYATAGELTVTHLFATTLAGYRGWVWSVTLSRAESDEHASVCEAHLIPADDALLAPAWVPWAERLQPGDLEAAMVLPLIKEDGRLVPGYEATGEEDEDALALYEFGLGRERVLGAEGREAAADRWYKGSHGPTAASAIASTSPCGSCGFFTSLAGSLRANFGVCTNEWSPSDGKVVSLDHGCGAHSQTDVEKQATQWPADDPVLVTDAVDPMDLDAPDPEPEPEPVLASEDATDAVEEADTVDEADAESAADEADDMPVDPAEEPVAE